MKLNRDINRVGASVPGRNRRGATAVEFALVCPIVLGIMFGMLEISRMSTIIDAARTSVITGAREARVVNSSSETIQEEMEEILTLFGVRDTNIEISPSVIDATVETVSIDIEVPFNATNGLFLVTLPQSNNLNLNIEITR